MTLNNVLIQEITLTQAASLVTFSNISQEYTDLRIVASMRDSGDDLVRFSMGFNSTSKTTTTRKVLLADGSSVSSSTLSTNTSVGYGSTRSTGTANAFGNVEIYIPNYTSSNYKSFSVDATEETNHAVNSLRSISAGIWANTAAITSLSIICDAPNFAAGSSFTLYGISKLGVTPTLTPKATGGDIIKNDGTYWYHAFLSTGAFIPQTTLSCDYLVVAGGGAGGGSWGGGGGAGGYRAGSALALTGNTMYAVAVGAGAAGANSNGANGGNSSISTITSAGGGGGGYYFDAGRAGGSGGGGAGGYGGTGNHGVGGAGNTPSTSPSQGNNGGEGYSPSDYSGNRYGGGGGGSAAVGASATSGSGGTGGAGTSNSITGTAVTYAAGGNGNALGGGAGAAGTGNGGAGGGESVAGSNGGSGIVIVRYAMA